MVNLRNNEPDITFKKILMLYMFFWVIKVKILFYFWINIWTQNVPIDKKKIYFFITMCNLPKNHLIHSQKSTYIYRKSFSKLAFEKLHELSQTFWSKPWAKTKPSLGLGETLLILSCWWVTISLAKRSYLEFVRG